MDDDLVLVPSTLQNSRTSIFWLIGLASVFALEADSGVTLGSYLVNLKMFQDDALSTERVLGYQMATQKDPAIKVAPVFLGHPKKTAKPGNFSPK